MFVGSCELSIQNVISPFIEGLGETVVDFHRVLAVGGCHCTSTLAIRRVSGLDCEKRGVRYLARHVDPDVLDEVADRPATTELPLAISIKTDSGLVAGTRVDVQVDDT